MTGIYDLHTHTVFSDGKLKPQEIWEIAKEKGYRVGIADHCGRGSFQLQNDAQMQGYLQALKALPVFRSVELDLGNDGGVSQGWLSKCDYLIGGVHSLEMDNGRLDFFDPGAALPPARRIVEGMLAVIEEGAERHRFHILAHPGLLPLALREAQEEVLGDVWEEGLISLAVRCGFALEISSRWQLPTAGTIERARRRGVKFAFGSDGHDRDRVCRLDYSLQMRERCRLTAEDFFEPRQAERLESGLSSTTGPTGSARSAP